MKLSKKLLYAALMTILLAPVLIKLTLTAIGQNNELTSMIYIATMLIFIIAIFAIAYIYFEFIDYRKKQEIK